MIGCMYNVCVFAKNYVVCFSYALIKEKFALLPSVMNVVKGD
jgi:hypothetical protein